MCRKPLLLLPVLLISFLILPKEAAAAGCEAANIVFSEIDYSILGPEDAEFVELYFLADVTLTDCELRIINDDPGAEPVYSRADINGAYSAGQFVVVGNAGTGSIPLTRDGTQCTEDCIDNGPRDGLVLVNTSTGNVEAAISYEGQFTYLGVVSEDIGCSEPQGAGAPDPTGSCQNGPEPGNGDWAYLDPPTPGSVGPLAITMSAFSASAVSNSAQVLGVSFFLLALTGLCGWMLNRRRHG